MLIQRTKRPAMAQTGHIMQGAGSVNHSMGGAATGQPLDISGALQWNPASISTFDGTIISFDIGLFSSSPTLYSTVPEFDWGFHSFQKLLVHSQVFFPLPASDQSTPRFCLQWMVMPNSLRLLQSRLRRRDGAYMPK